jgi:uncharacterized protein YxeA
MTIFMHRIKEVRSTDQRQSEGKAVTIKLYDENGNNLTVFFNTKAEARDHAIKCLSAILVLPDDEIKEPE